MDLPARFRNNNDEEEEDGMEASQTNPETFVQQSVFGILAGVQEKSSLIPNLPYESESDSDSEDTGRSASRHQEREGNEKSAIHRSDMEGRQLHLPRPEARRHQKSKSNSDTKLLKSVLKPMRDTDDPQDDDHMSQSQLLPPKEGSPKQLSSSGEQSKNTQNRPAAAAMAGSEEDADVGASNVHSPRSLSRVLAEMFHFPSPEKVISEHPCWYLQSVLLQGYMYITEQHVCFYAYLPKKGHLVKSGHLGKQGKHRSRYRRYWFTLKGDILSYFISASEPFFPAGTIDLRFATAAQLAPEKGPEASTDVTTFSITTNNRNHYFTADSPASAKEWVRQLQKVIVRAQNEGDSVKICIPIKEIVDIEQNPILDMAETVKIRVLDAEETYAMDEYFFTFFSGGDHVLSTLTAMTEGNNDIRINKPPDRATGLTSGQPDRLKYVDTNIPSSSLEASVESNKTALSDAEQSSAQSDSQGDGMSASQMLFGDDGFRTPTIRRPEGLFPESGAQAVPRRHPADAAKEGNLARVPDTGAVFRTPGTLATSLQHAYTIAEAVRSQGKRMSSYLSSSPKNYYEKISGAIAGGKRHYADASGLGIDDGVDDPELDLENAEHERRFQQHFALPPTEKLCAVYYCSLHRVLPLYGKIYIGDTRFCFRSLLYGTRTKLVVPFKEIDNITKEKGFRWGYPGMVLIIRRHEELFFDFGSSDARDDCVVTVLRALDVMKISAESVILTEEERDRARAAAAEKDVLEDARKVNKAVEASDAGDPDRVPRGISPLQDNESVPAAIDLRPKKSLRITCLTVGSRGDVQPYIALCKGLMRDGHQVKIATHAQFGAWIRSHGIAFEPVAGDPAELMRMCVENGMFTPSFVLEATSKFSDWLEGLLETSWKACANSDLLIESPCAMGGLHIAEALQIPYFRAFTMPWTRTRAYPHAFAKHGKRLGGQYNYTSYTIFDFFFWMLMSSHINRWRKNQLGLQSTDATKMQTNKVPFLYNFSPSVVPPPLDYSDWIKITGYWFLDEGDGWQPPADLMDFIQQARKDKMKLVYIGFGSVPVSDSKALTQQIVDGVLMADVRCILSKGWSDHFAKDDPTVPEVELPSAIFQIIAAPHDWLFKQVDAVLHHGGAGTTGASLRAGLPTIIKPFFGDQFFFASRVEDLGVGVRLEKFTTNSLGKAIWCATHDERMRTKARLLGEQIRAEDGVQTAIDAIYRDLDYARSLIKRRGVPTPSSAAEEDDEAEENWTFVENDIDIDVENARSGNLATSWLSPQQNAHYSGKRSGLSSMALRIRGGD